MTSTALMQMVEEYGFSLSVDNWLDIVEGVTFWATSERDIRTLTHWHRDLEKESSKERRDGLYRCCYNITEQRFDTFRIKIVPNAEWNGVLVWCEGPTMLDERTIRELSIEANSLWQKGQIDMI